MLSAASMPRNCSVNRTQPALAFHASKANPTAIAGNTIQPVLERTQITVEIVMINESVISAGRHNRVFALARMSADPMKLGPKGPPAAIIAREKREASAGMLLSATPDPVE